MHNYELNLAHYVHYCLRGPLSSAPLYSIKAKTTSGFSAMKILRSPDTDAAFKWCLLRIVKSQKLPAVLSV